MEIPLNAAFWTPDKRRILTLIKNKYKSPLNSAKGQSKALVCGCKQVWAWPIYLLAVPGWLRTFSDWGTAGTECPWKVEGLVLEFSPTLPSRVSPAAACVSRVTPGASRGRFHPTFKLLLLAGMGKGGDTEHHKGLYGEGKILNLENLTPNHSFHQCVCHQPPCKLKYCPLKYKPIVSAAYLDPSPACRCLY